MKKIDRVIMVDDDPYSHMICSKIICRITGVGLEFLEFTSPEKGIEYLETVYTDPANDRPAILLLDINMPVMSGWDFLERYDQNENINKSLLTIYLLSSSVDQRDKDRAAANKHIRDFLMKPFRKEMVEIIFKEPVDKAIV